VIVTRIYAFASVALIGLLVDGRGRCIWLGQDASDDLFAQCRTTSVAGGSAQIGGPFTLVSETGETVTDRMSSPCRPCSISATPSVPMSARWTPCATPRPVDILEEQGIMVQPVMITVDPERDTPEVMDDFTANVHPRMLGLTGTPEQTDAAARAYRVYYRINRDGDDPYYLVDHSAFAYLVLPEYGFVEFFNREVTPAEMAETTACFVEAAAGGS
jgi:protein SCO1/2